MRRLTHMLRSDAERGATAIVAALLLTVLLGFAGLAIDLGASYAKHTELQNGADAAALALAQEYAASEAGCTEDGSMANTWVRSNVKNDPGSATGDPDCLPSGNELTVTASSDLAHWFMPVVGKDSSSISADATVEWGTPVRGNVTFPIAFSTCEFEEQLGDGVIELNTTKDSDTFGKVDCGYSDTWPPSDNNFPGGFGFLLSDEGGCTPYITADGWVGSNQGNSVGGMGCTFPDLQFTALVPLFDDCKTGSPAASGACRQDPSMDNKEDLYHIEKFAAFRVHGYDFNAAVKDGVGCTKKPCIVGEFVEYVDLGEDFELDPSVPEDGVLIVRLTD